jgi:nucleoside-diphosphate-sugar epimerase
MIGKNILITGANGYIGSSIVKKLRLTNNLFLLSRSGGKDEKNITHIKADITKKNSWKNSLNNVDVVFHLAAQTSSQYANLYPIKDLEINLIPIVNLIETCEKYHFSPDIIFAGTATETGFTEKKSINGNIKDQPCTAYDINKLASEKYLQYYSKQLNNRAVTLRLSNVFGPGPKSSKSDRGIVNLMIKNALDGKSISIYGNGNFLRDYIYIDDIADAFIQASICIKKTQGKYYTVGTGIGHTILQMATIIKEEIAQITGKIININLIPFPINTSLIEYRSFIADSSEFKKDTSWYYKISLREGIKKTISYFLS